MLHEPVLPGLDWSPQGRLDYDAAGQLHPCTGMQAIYMGGEAIQHKSQMLSASMQAEVPQQHQACALYCACQFTILYNLYYIIYRTLDCTGTTPAARQTAPTRMCQPTCAIPAQPSRNPQPRPARPPGLPCRALQPQKGPLGAQKAPPRIPRELPARPLGPSLASLPRLQLSLKQTALLQVARLLGACCLIDLLQCWRTFCLSRAIPPFKCWNPRARASTGSGAGQSMMFQ